MIMYGSSFNVLKWYDSDKLFIKTLLFFEKHMYPKSWLLLYTFFLVKQVSISNATEIYNDMDLRIKTKTKRKIIDWLIYLFIDVYIYGG